MSILAVIIARAGSKGLPDKCVRPLCGKPVLAYTIEHAQAAGTIDSIVLTTDSPQAVDIAHRYGIHVVDRPYELATDEAPVDATVRHALEAYEVENDDHADVIVLLPGNVPVRRDGIIDECVEHLLDTGCDSVRTVTPVGKWHPDWMFRLDNDHMTPFKPSSIHRRQDLEPLYALDGAVYVMTRGALYSPPKHEDDHQAFLGDDRRAIVQAEEDVVDIDNMADLYRAEAVLRARSEADVPSRIRLPRRPAILTGAVAYSYHERR